jgi:RimJ/RimL family protein N-acetyltransferase
LSWLNDPEVTRYLETGIFPTSQEDLEHYYESLRGSRDQVLFAIEELTRKQHIGNVKLGPIHWVHRSATLGILIGEKAYWGKGVGQEATRLMVEYGFFRLNLNRINLGVFADHESAIRCYTKAGFKVEGHFRQALFRDGAYKDHLWMAVLRSEYFDMRRERTHMSCYVYLAGNGSHEPGSDDLERQLTVIREYATAQKITIEKVFRERYSSETLENRPALKDLLASLHSGSVELVLVESFNSLFRDVVMRESIFAQTEPYGFEIRSVTEPDL